MLNKNNEVTFKYKNSTSLIDILKYLFVIFTILFNSVYFYLLNSHYIKYTVDVGWQMLLVALCALAIVKHSKEYMGKILFFSSIFFITIMIILIFYYLYFPYSLNYILEFAIDPTLIIIFFYGNSTDKHFDLSFFYIFERIMVILAIFSLIFYVIYYLGLRPNSNLIVHWSNNPDYPGYFYVYFFPVNNYNIMGINVLRNSGIFIEPPTYSYFLYVALLINLFIFNKRNKSNFSFIILILAIFSTFSTTGMILSILSVIIYELLYNKNKLFKLLLIIFIPVFTFLIKVLFDMKKNAPTTDIYSTINSSYYVRHNDMIAFIQDWIHHILIGNGLGNTNSVYKYINPLRLVGNSNDLGLTASFIELLAYGGILLSLLYVIPTILSLYVSPNISCFVFLNFVVFLVEGIMLYKIYIIILSCCVSMYLWKKFVLSKA